MKIALGADHAGYEYKDRIAQLLRDNGHEILDYGTHDATPVDYPQYGYVVGEAVATGQADRGVVVCGSSLGIAIAANKVPGVRCAPSRNRIRRELRAATTTQRDGLFGAAHRMGDDRTSARVYLETPFDGGRHAYRIEQLFEFGDAQRARTLKDMERGEVTGAQTPKEFLCSVVAKRSR